MANNESLVVSGFGICRFMLGIVFGASLLACVARGPVSAPTQSPSAQAVDLGVDSVAQQARLEAQRAQVVESLLISARQALAADRLMHPLSDSAYSWYQQVLAIDELNAAAHKGMQQITARYLQLAQQAFTEGRVERAEQMLQGAEKIAATPAQTKALREKYQRQPAVNETLLSRESLSARNDAMRATLVKLAKRAQAANSRLLIVARNDAEGRWIYQQMRSAVAGYRLRGNIDIGRVPRVVLIDL